MHCYKITTIAAAAAALMLNAASQARWAMPSNAPVERIVKNLQAYLEEHPGNPDALYHLARAHSLAYAKNSDEVPVYRRGDGPSEVARGWQAERAEGGEPLDEKELRHHLRQGIIYFNKAIEADPSQPLPYLGLASLLEAGKAAAGDIDVAPWLPSQPAQPAAKQTWPTVETLAGEDWSVTQLAGAWREARYIIRQPRRYAAGIDEAGRTRDLFIRYLLNHEAFGSSKVIATLLQEDWNEQIAELYFYAFAYALPVDSKRDQQPMRGVSELVAYEAGKGYLRAMEALPDREDQQLRVQIVESALAAMEALPPMAARTPIIFDAVKGDSSLADLVNAKASVAFNLDGTGRPQSWNWVSENAAFLVWDPQGTGQITSGRQLFGNATWWMLFPDGYRALDALDDDRNGWLEGLELVGIRGWVDGDSDGVSDPGEVRDLSAFQIEAIAVEATCIQAGCPSNLAGLRMAGGGYRATYDWIARSQPLEVTKQSVEKAALVDKEYAVGGMPSR